MFANQRFMMHWSDTRLGTKFRPYYALFDERPVGSPAKQQRILAAFDVDLLGALEKMQWPHLDRQEGRMIVDYFEALAKDVLSKVDQHCMVEIVVYADSQSLDTREHLQPQATLRFV